MIQDYDSGSGSNYGLLVLHSHSFCKWLLSASDETDIGVSETWRDGRKGMVCDFTERLTQNTHVQIEGSYMYVCNFIS